MKPKQNSNFWEFPQMGQAYERKIPPEYLAYN